MGKKSSWNNGVALALLPIAYLIGHFAGGAITQYFGVASLPLQFTVTVITALASYAGGYAAYTYLASDNSTHSNNISTETQARSNAPHSPDKYRSASIAQTPQSSNDVEKSSTHFRDLLERSDAILHSRDR